MCRSKCCVSANTKEENLPDSKTKLLEAGEGSEGRTAALKQAASKNQRSFFLFLFLAIFTILLSDQVQGYFGYSREQWLLYAPYMRLFQSIPSHTSQPAPASHLVTPAESDELAGNRRLMDWR